MDKFNEWFDSEHPNFSSNQDNEFCKTAKDYAYAGFQSRQAELDEKDKRIEMCKALFINYYNGGSDTDDLLDDLEKALRGDDDINVTR